MTDQEQTDQKIYDVDRRAIAVGDKLDKLRDIVTNIDKSEGSCRAEMKSDIKNGERRMDSHRDDIANIGREIFAIREKISALDKTDGEQEQHLDNTDSNVLKLTSVVDGLLVRSEKSGKNEARNQGGVAVLIFMVGILQAILLHFWKP